MTGTDLNYYVLNSDGEYELVSINSLIQHGETYYISQMSNGCESEFLAVTTNLECPEPTDLSINVSMSTDGQSGAIVVNWVEPADVTSVLGYYIVVLDENDNQLFDELVDEGDDYAVFTGLNLNSEYEVQIYSVCDENIPVYSEMDSFEFDTYNLSNDSVIFNSLRYYPNPTNDMVYIQNDIQIDSIELYGLTGQLIMNKQVNNVESSVDLSALASGVYFMNVKVKDASKVVRVIKQ